jgi:gluconolactonase
MRPVLLLLISLGAFAQQAEVVVEKIATGLRYTDGPAWSPDGFLIFSDTVTNKLHKWAPGHMGDIELADIAGGPSGNAYDSQGRLYTCEFRERRITRTGKNGKTEVIAARFEGKRFNAPNDIVVRHDGHAYFTDPAFGNQQDSRELDFYGVFHITPKGEVEAIARLKTRPNGIALSLNGKTLYVTDSDARAIRAYELDGKGGEGRVIVDKIPGVPDGIRIDEKGNLWVAAKSLYSYSPQGKLLQEVGMPETPSNLAFGDGDNASIFVTARTSIYRVRAGVKGPPQNREQ